MDYRRANWQNARCCVWKMTLQACIGFTKDGEPAAALRKERAEVEGGDVSGVKKKLESAAEEEAKSRREEEDAKRKQEEEEAVLRQKAAVAPHHKSRTSRACGRACV